MRDSNVGNVDSRFLNQRLGLCSTKVETMFLLQFSLYTQTHRKKQMYKDQKQSCRQNHSKCDWTIEWLSKIDRTKNTYKDARRCFKLESLYRKLFLIPGKVIYHDVKADAVNLARYCLLNDSRNRRNHNRTQSLFICLGWEKIRVRLGRAGTHGKGRHDTQRALTKP